MTDCKTSLSVKKIALITGASSGLGEEFARQISQLSSEKAVDELWLLARRRERLEKLAAELDLPCRIFALDLLEEENYRKIMEALKEESQKANVFVKYLVNSAGYGKQGCFSEQEEVSLNNCLQLNIFALEKMTYLLSPYLAKDSHVFQISSVSAFLPQPNYASYAASKTYVLHFSRALHQEWKKRGINVLCVCPNLMETEFLSHANMSEQTRNLKNLGLEKPEDVVEKAIKDSYSGKDLSISSLSGKLIRLAAKIFPTRLILFLEKKWGLF